MDQLSLESRINAEVYSFSGKIGLYLNDFKGNVVEINADEKFETASTIKSFILVELYRQVQEGKVNLNDVLKYEEENFVVGSGIIRDLDMGIEMTVKATLPL